MEDKLKTRMVSGVFSLASLFAITSAQGDTELVNVVWDPPQTMLPVCNYMLFWKETPGFPGDPGTEALVVPAPQVTAQIPIDRERHMTTVVVLAAYPLEGQGCAGATEFRRSATSNFVATSPWIDYYKLLNPSDVDGDGLPDNMEVSFTITDPGKANSTGICGDLLNDLETMIVYEAVSPFAWYPGMPLNALTDPAKVQAACNVMTNYKVLPSSP